MLVSSQPSSSHPAPQPDFISLCLSHLNLNLGLRLTPGEAVLSSASARGSLFPHSGSLTAGSQTLVYLSAGGNLSVLPTNRCEETRYILSLSPYIPLLGTAMDFFFPLPYPLFFTSFHVVKNRIANLPI